MRGRLAQGEHDKARSDIRSHGRPFHRSEAGDLLIVTWGMSSGPAGNGSFSADTSDRGANGHH